MIQTVLSPRQKYPVTDVHFHGICIMPEYRGGIRFRITGMGYDHKIRLVLKSLIDLVHVVVHPGANTPAGSKKIIDYAYLTLHTPVCKRQPSLISKGKRPYITQDRRFRFPVVITGKYKNKKKGGEYQKKYTIPQQFLIHSKKIHLQR